MDPKYKKAVLGGTFDHLHVGHKHFIKKALEQTQFLSIGLVQNIFEEKAFSSSIESFDMRKANLERWLSEDHYHEGKFEIIPINDIYGTTLSNKEIQAIFVTEHGLSNAKEINRKRTEANLPKLKIISVDFLKDEDGRIISSTRIRAGEINREGFEFIKILDTTLILPKDLRDEVRNIPSGQLLRNDHELLSFIEGKVVYAVGDIISQKLINLDKQAHLSVIDLKTRRGDVTDSKISNAVDLTVENESGAINHKAILTLNTTIKEIANQKRIILVDGEEDLLALPLTLLAPLGSIILYGMPEQGVIGVLVTEEKKEEVLNVLRKFQRAV